jgi:hypothetical protein
VITFCLHHPIELITQLTPGEVDYSNTPLHPTNMIMLGIQLHSSLGYGPGSQIIPLLDALVELLGKMR